MKIPKIRGVIDRRILVNYRVDPEVMAKLLPNPFRPQLVNGFGVAGICMIRLHSVRPRFIPAALGIQSENCAHRFAVAWEADGVSRTGVYIPRRDTSSWLNACAGGRIFPGTHHLAQFQIKETDSDFHLQIDSRDDAMHIRFEGSIAPELVQSSLFKTTKDASYFFEKDSLGYSPDKKGVTFDALELETMNWSVTPLSIQRCESSYFQNETLFPLGSIELDHALLMRGIDHVWNQQPSLCCVANS